MRGNRLIAFVAAMFATFFVLSPASAATTERSVYYSYDVMGRQLSAKFDNAAGGTHGEGITNSYDGFGDLVSSQVSIWDPATSTQFTKTLTSAYDGAGRRTQVTHPDGQAFTYAYDALSRLSGIYQGVGTASPLDTFTYGTNGLVASRAETGGSSVGYSWDDIGRLLTQGDAFAGGTGNVSRTFAFNPASDIATETRDNDSYAFPTAQIGSVNRAYAVNGLNQYTSAGSASFTYDANGNLITDGTWTYTYDVENRLIKAVTGSTTVNLTYDPLGRLFQVDKGSTATTTKFVYDGDADVLEYNSGGAVTNRYVHGSNAAADDPLVWYAGSTLGTLRYLHADHLGSIASIASSTGANYAIDTYDEYGINGSANNTSERFGYTGQAYIPELGLYYYKARFYSPTLGRFLQTDPIGYKGGINIYEYVGDDPVDGADPTGLYDCTGGHKSASCAAIKQFVQAINSSLKNLDPKSDQYAKVSAVAKRLGTEGDHGIKLNPTTIKGTALAQAGKNGSIDIDVSKISKISAAYLAGNPGMSSPDIANDLGAGAVGHEVRHEMDYQRLWHGNLPSNKGQEYRTEMNAYTVEAGIWQGLGFRSGLWNPDMTSEEEQQAISRAAQTSTNIWCSEGGNCGP